MTLRIAVIGAGVMGSDHARIIAEDLPEAALHVLCDPDEARARALGDALGAADVSTDALQTVSRADVDAVIIASPDDTHADVTLAAIKAGKPVLCEKPLAPTSEACLKVIEAECALAKQMIWIGFMRRFDPGYTAMRTALTDGKIGSSVMMHNFHRNVVAPKAFAGQMAISNSAPHEFDIARFLLGAEVLTISAFQGKSDKAIAPVVMVLETDAGQIVTIEVNNNAAYGYDVRCEIVGTKGSVDLGTPVHARLNAELSASVQFAEDWRPRFAEAYRLQNKGWVQSILTGRTAGQAASAWDGYCAALIAEAGVQALASGRKATLNMIPKPALYA